MKIINDELGKQAYKKVRGMILSKRLQPGQKIVQDKLAEELGISRTPLRSALQMLEAEYLIEAAPRKGVRVKAFTNQEIIEIYDCRIALEGTAIRLFTQRATSSDIQKLNKLFDPFQNNTNKIDSVLYQKADSQFHNTIIKKCGNGFLTKLFQQGNLLVCIELIGLVRPAKETLPEHIAIISAVEERNVDLAERLSKDHLDKSKQLIIRKVKDEG
ncbi:MAG: GntR family transcriptional regulator [Bacteroidota bacterium]